MTSYNQYKPNIFKINLNCEQNVQDTQDITDYFKENISNVMLPTSISHLKLFISAKGNTGIKVYVKDEKNIDSPEIRKWINNIFKDCEIIFDKN